MDPQIQLNGLDRFLAEIYGEETHFTALIDGLGFDRDQTRTLREDCLESVAGQFIEAVRKKLTFGERDLWFRLLSRRFGLDGEPPAALDVAARALDIDYGSAAQAESDALQKCSYKSTLQELERELHRIALDELSRVSPAPANDDVAQKLTRLADLRAAVDVTRMDYESKKTEVLKKVQAELDALEAEYQPLLDAAEQNAEALESEIKNDVLLAGHSVSTGVYQAVYMKGRVTWDGDGIGRYAVTHPEVLQFRKQGQPTVSLRSARQ